MKKFGRVVLIALLILLALVISAATVAETDWAREMVEDLISQRMDGREVTIGDLHIDWGSPIAIEATDVNIANANWAKHLQMISVAALKVTIKVAPLFRGEVSLGTVKLHGPQLHLARRKDGTSNWAALIPEKDKEEPPLQPDTIHIHNGQFTYRDKALDANISVAIETLETPAERRVQVAGSGSFQGRSFELDAAGGAPSEALETDIPYPVDVVASLGEMQLSFEGESLNIYTLQALHGELQFTAPDQAQLSKLSNLFDPPGLTVPPLELQAKLNHQDKRWTLKNIQASAGSSQLRGSASVQITETPDFNIDLDSERLDLNEFGITQMLSNMRNTADRKRGAERGVEHTAEDNQQDKQNKQQASWGARVANMFAPLRHYQGSADVQVHELILGEARLDQLTIKGSLHAGRLQIDQLHASQGSGFLEANGWIDATVDDASIAQSPEFKALDIQFTIAGLNPAQLKAVSGWSLPDLPQYEASGRLRLAKELLRVTDLQASFGESDLGGDVRVSFNGRTMLWATLHSNQLNTTDLEALARAADKSDEQATKHTAKEVFNHEPLDVQVLRRLNAEIRYRADNIVAKNIPLSNVALDASLDKGVLRITPLRVGLGGGDVRVESTLQALGPVLQANVDVSMKQVKLGPLLRNADLPQLAKDTAGLLNGKGTLRFEGESIAELMAELNGTVELAMSDGHLDLLAVELLGLDAGEALIAAVSNAEQVPLLCTYVKAVADSGLITMEHFYINTVDTSITGGGTINLATEQLDLTISPHAKDFSLLAGDTPVALKGSLGDANVEILRASLIAKGAASVVSAFIAPPLAILPWIELGTGENVGPGCQQALQEYREQSE